MKPNGRPIGRRIREVCEIAERIGPATSRKIFEHMTGVAASNAGKYCARAVEHGFMTVDTSGARHLFAAASDWRTLIERPAKPVRPTKPAIRAPERSALEAVWMR